jgi:hypothetical protein
MGGPFRPLSKLKAPIVMSRNNKVVIYFKAHSILVTLILTCALLSFAPLKNLTYAKIMPPQKEIEITIGENGESFSRRNPQTGPIERHPSGLNFYTLHWPFNKMGTAIVRQGTVIIRFPNVISITGSEDMDYQEDGISEIHINSAITSSQTISHDEARLKTFAFLKVIHDSGWHTTIPRSMARIRGKDMNNYLLETGRHTTLDPMYIPTLAEWMQYSGLTTWAFYADHTYLTVQLTREHTLTDPLKPGAYLLSTNLEGENQHYRGYVDGLERPRWRELLMQEIVQIAKTRATAEAGFRSKGITIDDSYVDPPLPNFTTK